MAQDGSCLYLSSELVGWNTAKTRCEDMGGHLVMIKCAEQQQRVENFISGESLYTVTGKCNTTLIINNVKCDRQRCKNKKCDRQTVQHLVSDPLYH